MYKVSDNYKIACKALSRQSRSKIVIDNITYDGAEYIKEYPKFSHSNEKIVGGFPTKTVSFSLWTKNGKIDLIDKEIKVYRGLVINDIVEWIQQGVFFCKEKDISTSDTGNYITVKAYDSSKKLGTMLYKDDNVYPISETNYIKNVIEQSGFELDLDYFVESDYIMKQQPNIDESTSIREIVSRYAEQRGAIALFSRNNKIQIKKPTKVDFQYKFYEYKKLNCENQYGPVEQLVIGNSNINNNVVYPELANPDFVLSINDNPFLDLIRQDRLIDVFESVKELYITPFDLSEALDCFFLDLNDIIEIQKKDGSFKEFTILSIETVNRLKCNIKASHQLNSDINYKLAGSTKNTIERIKFDVDYVKKEIDATIEKVDDSAEKVSQMLLDVDSIKNTVSNSSSAIEDNIESLKQQLTILQQTANNLSITITSINQDGVNKVVTSNGFVFDENGLNLSKDGEPMSATLNWEGLLVKNYDTNLLDARGDRVITENLTVKKYLVTGRHRIEKFTDEKGRRCTGFFWLGDDQ